MAGLPEALVLEAAFDVQGSELFARGAIMAQARGSMLAGRALSPVPGDRVLDLCAAPGAKTSQLAALIEDRGELVAVERNPGRARGLLRDARPHAVSAVRECEVGDAAAFADAGGFDAVLVDPPCSGLGTLQSRPDLRWRTSLERIAERCRCSRRGFCAPPREPPRRRRNARLLGLHDLARRRAMAVVEALLHERPDFAAEPVCDLLAGGGRRPVPADTSRPRRHRRFLHRPAAPPVAVTASVSL